VIENIAIIVAGGTSIRFGHKDKLLEPVCGFPLIYHTIRAFNDHPLISRVIIVASSSNKKAIQKLVDRYGFPKVASVILGGKERFNSVEKGLKAIKKGLSTIEKTGTGQRQGGKIRFKKAQSKETANSKQSEPKETDIILIHNGANPLVTEKEITDCIKGIEKYGAAAVGGKVVDTIKEIKGGHIIKTHDRVRLAGMQTPQGATYSLLKKAFTEAKKQLGSRTSSHGKASRGQASQGQASRGKASHGQASRGQATRGKATSAQPSSPASTFTDDAALIENLGHKVKLIPASEHNFKVTTPHDLEKVKHIMGDTPKDFLVGLGQDSHEFSAVTRESPTPSATSALS